MNVTWSFALLNDTNLTNANLTNYILDWDSDDGGIIFCQTIVDNHTKINECDYLKDSEWANDTCKNKDGIEVKRFLFDPDLYNCKVYVITSKYIINCILK